MGRCKSVWPTKVHYFHVVIGQHYSSPRVINQGVHHLDPRSKRPTEPKTPNLCAPPMCPQEPACAPIELMCPRPSRKPPPTPHVHASTQSVCKMIEHPHAPRSVFLLMDPSPQVMNRVYMCVCVCVATLFIT
jgi:hypothetical protein